MAEQLPKWADVSTSPEFQAADSATREAMRMGYREKLAELSYLAGGDDAGVKQHLDGFDKFSKPGVFQRIADRVTGRPTAASAAAMGLSGASEAAAPTAQEIATASSPSMRMASSGLGRRTAQPSLMVGKFDAQADAAGAGQVAPFSKIGLAAIRDDVAANGINAGDRAITDPTSAVGRARKLAAQGLLGPQVRSPEQMGAEQKPEEQSWLGNAVDANKLLVRGTAQGAGSIARAAVEVPGRIGDWYDSKTAYLGALLTGETPEQATLIADKLKASREGMRRDVIDPLAEKGGKILDYLMPIAESTKKETESDIFEGNPLKGEAPTLKQDASLRRVVMKMYQTLGQMAPIVLGGVLTAGAKGGMAVGGALGFAQAADEGGSEESKRIRELTPSQMREIPLYKQYRTEGLSHEEAVLATSADAGRAASLVQGMLGSLDGLLFPGAGAVARKIIAKVALKDGAVQGMQEAAESAGSRTAASLAVGEKLDPERIGKGLYDDAALGAVTGKVIGGSQAAGSNAALKAEEQASAKFDASIKQGIADKVASTFGRPTPVTDGITVAPETKATSGSRSATPVIQKNATVIQDEPVSADVLLGARPKQQQSAESVPAKGVEPQKNESQQSPQAAAIALGARTLKKGDTVELDDGGSFTIDGAGPMKRSNPDGPWIYNVIWDNGKNAAFDDAEMSQQLGPQPYRSADFEQKYSAPAVVKRSEAEKSGKVFDAVPPPADAGQPAGQMQNRDRARAASVVQMNAIANKPDYDLAGPSNSPEMGAPMASIVENAKALPDEQMGDITGWKAEPKATASAPAKDTSLKATATLAQAIRKLGGLPEKFARDLTGEPALTANKMPGYRGLFHASGTDLSTLVHDGKLDAYLPPNLRSDVRDDSRPTDTDAAVAHIEAILRNGEAQTAKSYARTEAKRQRLTAAAQKQQVVAPIEKGDTQASADAISEAEYEHFKQTGEPGFGWMPARTDAIEAVAELSDDDLAIAALVDFTKETQDASPIQEVARGDSQTQETPARGSEADNRAREEAPPAAEVAHPFHAVVKALDAASEAVRSAIPQAEQLPNQGKLPAEFKAAIKATPGFVGYFVDVDNSGTMSKARDTLDDKPLGSYIIVRTGTGKHYAYVSTKVDRFGSATDAQETRRATSPEQLAEYITEIHNATNDAARPQLDLTNPTESKLRTDDAKQKRDAAEKAAKENAPSPEEFGLVGSNRAADVGAAAGQEPLFSRSNTIEVDGQQPAATNTHAADVIAKAAKTVNIPLDVYATPQEASAKLGIYIPSDVRGLHYRGRAALISSNITTRAMGEFVLWHELFHAGITLVAPRYSNEYNRIMQDMAARNSNIIKAARDWSNSYGAETIKRSMEAGLSQEQAEKRMRLMAIEEAIADLAGANVELKGWTQFVAKLQALLRSMGFDNLANWIEGKSNAEVLQLIARTRDEVTTQNLHLTTQVPAFAREDEPLESHAEPTQTVEQTTSQDGDVAKTSPEVAALLKRLSVLESLRACI